MPGRRCGHSHRRTRSRSTGSPSAGGRGRPPRCRGAVVLTGAGLRVLRVGVLHQPIVTLGGVGADVAGVVVQPELPRERVLVGVTCSPNCASDEDVLEPRWVADPPRNRDGPRLAPGRVLPVGAAVLHRDAVRGVAGVGALPRLGGDGLRDFLAGRVRRRDRVVVCVGDVERSVLGIHRRRVRTDLHGADPSARRVDDAERAAGRGAEVPRGQLTSGPWLVKTWDLWVVSRATVRSSVAL